MYEFLRIRKTLIIGRATTARPSDAIAFPSKYGKTLGRFAKLIPAVCTFPNETVSCWTRRPHRAPGAAEQFHSHLRAFLDQ